MASHHQPANDASALTLRDALRFSLVIEAEQQDRHAWLAPAAEQIKRWRKEDAEAGMPWGAA